MTFVYWFALLAFAFFGTGVATAVYGQQALEPEYAYLGVMLIFISIVIGFVALAGYVLIKPN